MKKELNKVFNDLFLASGGLYLNEPRLFTLLMKGHSKTEANKIIDDWWKKKERQAEELLKEYKK